MKKVRAAKGQNQEAMHKPSKVVSRRKNTGKNRKKIIEEQNHLEDSKFSSQQ